MTATNAAHAAPGAGAASREEVAWHQINWQRAHRNVRRLQARIVQATQEGRWGRVKALQRLLTHSFSGKALAVRRVTENQGKRTPGVDGTVWDTPEKKATAIRALRQRGYRPRPLRRVYIPKSNGKLRPLGIPTMADRAMQTLYLLALDPIAETTGDPNSYGFRRERSTADAMEQCFTALSKADSAGWVLEGDIKSCFDRISHDWLLAHVPLDRVILRKWLKAGFMEQRALVATDEGTPQGGPISPVLANLALDGLERELRRRYPKGTFKVQRDRLNLIRYADDFIITGSSQELLEREIKPLVATFLRERGLELSDEKTTITRIEDGFDFLGQHVRKYNGKLLITPSRKNVQAFLRNVRGIIKANKQLPAGNLIARLNPVIRGWAYYHRHVVSSDAFHSVDHAIFETLWRWARRRHPKKGAGWVRRKYFRTSGTRHWVFAGETVDANGQTTARQLFAAADVTIKRHIKIRGTANPYDPQWETYFEKRLGVKMEATLAGRRTLLYLWKRQGGLCPHCAQPISSLTGWHNHHQVWRSHGGSDGAENRVLLHPTCHQQVHHPRSAVAPPRPITGALRKA